MYRVENDFIGNKQIPADALYGIHSLRAKNNFPDSTQFHHEWYCALGKIKLAVYLTYQDFVDALKKKNTSHNLKIDFIEPKILESLVIAASEVSSGKHFSHFIVPALTGGAGTSINLNINEIIANRALQVMGNNPGDYHLIDPLEHANVYQSTNDVVPSALKVAAIELLSKLEDKINLLRQSAEKIETSHRHCLRVGYTQMQQAVPTTYGRLFSTFSDALSRDWWRISKCWERIKMVNLGGSAIGTGITVPKYMVTQTARKLQQITGLPVTRAENLCDATANLDSISEVHGILKAHAVNLEKIASDIRLLASDFNRLNELSIPKKQIGSTIMPGKVNPVISEYVISVAHQVYANDQLITTLTGQGCLELNAYIPLIGHTLLNSLKLLISANETLKSNLLDGLSVDTGRAYNNVITSPSVVTALIPYIGYHRAGKIAAEMQKSKCTVFEANDKLQMIDNNLLNKIIEPSNLLKEGFSIHDL